MIDYEIDITQHSQSISPAGRATVQANDFICISTPDMNLNSDLQYRRKIGVLHSDSSIDGNPAIIIHQFPLIAYQGQLLRLPNNPGVRMTVEYFSWVQLPILFKLIEVNYPY